MVVGELELSKGRREVRLRSRDVVRASGFCGSVVQGLVVEASISTLLRLRSNRMYYTILGQILLRAMSCESILCWDDGQDRNRRLQSLRCGNGSIELSTVTINR